MASTTTAHRRRAAAVAAALGLAVAFLALAAGCRKPQPAGAKTSSAPRVEDMSWGPVRLVLTADPPQVDMSRDVLLTVRLSAPADMEIALPPIPDRLQGFVLSGSFDQDPYTQDGKTVRERHYRLTPVLADRYRIAPMAVEYTDKAANPPQAGWFATRPMVLERQRPVEGNPGTKVEVALKPLWIAPPFKTVLLYVLAAALLAAAAFAAWRVLGRVREQVRLMRMSPRERALHELSLLLAKDLVGKHQVKEFYLELTMIVRRYIERQHTIRAPEQTTEEFLQAVSRDPRFGAEVVARLKTFLTAADLVKFAAYQPDRRAIDKATSTARAYIETDTAALQADAAAGATEGDKRQGQE